MIIHVYHPGPLEGEGGGLGVKGGYDMTTF